MRSKIVGVVLCAATVIGISSCRSGEDSKPERKTTTTVEDTSPDTTAKRKKARTTTTTERQRVDTTITTTIPRTTTTVFVLPPTTNDPFTDYALYLADQFTTIPNDIAAISTAISNNDQSGAMVAALIVKSDYANLERPPRGFPAEDEINTMIDDCTDAYGQVFVAATSLSEADFNAAALLVDLCTSDTDAASAAIG